MVAADLTREEDCSRGVIEVPIHGLTSFFGCCAAAIYGANASGKSTLLIAGRALRWLGTDSSERSNPDAKIVAYEPFLLDVESRTSPIQLGC